MSFAFAIFEEKSRLKSRLDHFAMIEDRREAWRVAHPLAQVLPLVVCGTIADCDDYEAISARGATHLALLRRYQPIHRGVPGGRWLTQLMNRINPALFSTAFIAWVRETWPDRPGLIAIDGKTSRRSHDRRRIGDRCISSRPSPRRAASCSAKRRSKQRPTNSRRSRR